MQVLLGQEQVAALVPSTGRLRELLVPNARVWLQHVESATRKTAYTCELVEASSGVLVSLNTHRTNALVCEALEKEMLPDFAGWVPERQEVTFEDSRFDLTGSGPDGRWLMEVKSVTLLEGSTALFPDAPTARGAKHMRTLQRALQAGYRTGVVFCITREDATEFRPHHVQDPVFAEAVTAAQDTGVIVAACCCRVTPDGLDVTGPVEVNI